MSIEQFLKTVDESELDKQVQQKIQYVAQQKHKIITQIQQKISTIILVKKRKLQYESYNEAAERLKLFSTSAKNLIEIYFDLLQDEEKLILFNFADVKELVVKFRFCLFRSVHNMNRMLIKQNQSVNLQVQGQTIIPVVQQKKPTASKKKRRKKGKNSKMSIDQTGFMYKWILQNFQNPYPSQQQKQKLSADSNISISKVNYWFINMRQRTIKKLMTNQNTMNKKKKNDKENQKSQECSGGQQSGGQEQSHMASESL